VDITLTASDPDEDPLTYNVVAGPSNGSLSGTPPGLTYAPTENYNGSDSFTFKANDGTVDSDPATVSITVTSVNDPPVANDDSVATPEDTPVTINVVSNDTDVDGNLDQTSAEVLTGPSDGKVQNNSDGTFTYTPNASFLGTDSFIYEVCDSGGLCDTANIAVTVNPVSVHVGDLDGSRTSARNKWTATVTIAVHDVSHSPVEGATVTGSWSGGPATPGSCTTGSSGECQVRQADIAKNVASVVFTVTEVTYDGTLTYRPDDNHDPDGDSNGTSITVSRESNQPPVASFTYTCTDLTCDFDALSSYDPDGTIVSYAWDFGDGNADSDVTASHEYGNDGTYTVILTVNDDGGASDTDAQNVPAGAGMGTIYIFEFDISGKVAGPNRSATAVVTIHDNNGNPVSGATVDSSWSGDYSATVSGITGADGTVTLTSGKVRTADATFTFTVDDVSKSGHTYDPSFNQDVTTWTVVVP